jgi:putative transposase
VARSGYWAWRSRGISPRAVADSGITERIRGIHRESRGTYGYPRVYAELRGQQVVGRNRVARLMKLAGLTGCHRKAYVRTTQHDDAAATAPDLVERRFISDSPDRLWVADFTYVPTNEGWLYLAFVLDACSRRIVGWSMAGHMRAELVADALSMAVSRRKPAGRLIHHSDRGAQYTSVEFGARIREAGILPSMGSRGDAYDNAMAESFVATIKKELIHREPWPTRAAVRSAIFEYIECFYNPRRRHSALGYLSPCEYERSTITQDIAA